MESLTKHEALLDHARAEFLEQRHAQARRAQLIMLTLGLSMFSIMGLVLFLDGGMLSGSVALGVSEILIMLYMI